MFVVAPKHDQVLFVSILIPTKKLYFKLAYANNCWITLAFMFDMNLIANRNEIKRVLEYNEKNQSNYNFESH